MQPTDWGPGVPKLVLASQGDLPFVALRKSSCCKVQLLWGSRLRLPPLPSALSPAHFAALINRLSILFSPLDWIALFPSVYFGVIQNSAHMSSSTQCSISPRSYSVASWCFQFFFLIYLHVVYFETHSIFMTVPSTTVVLERARNLFAFLYRYTIKISSIVSCWVYKWKICCMNEWKQELLRICVVLLTVKPYKIPCQTTKFHPQKVS